MDSATHLERIQRTAGDVLRLVNAFTLAREPRRARLLLDRLEGAHAAYRAAADAAAAGGALSEEHAKQAAEYDAKVSTAYASAVRAVA